LGLLLAEKGEKVRVVRQGFDVQIHEGGEFGLEAGLARRQPARPVERGQRLALELAEDRLQQQVGLEQGAVEVDAQGNSGAHHWPSGVVLEDSGWVGC
jgi:hypothetical protein